MKSKRRHELQHNVLDAELASIIGFLRKRGRYLLVGGIVVAVLAFAIYSFVKSRRDARQQRQAQFYGQMGAPPSRNRIDALKTLVEQSDDEGIKAEATVGLGDASANLLAMDRPQLDAAEREEHASQAQQWYRKAVDEFPDQSLAVAKARYGLAKLAEDRGQFDEAETEYGKILQMAASLQGQPIIRIAQLDMRRLAEIRGTVRMATTAPAPPEPTSMPTSMPTSLPTSLPAVPPASGPATAPASRPAGS